MYIFAEMQCILSITFHLNFPNNIIPIFPFFKNKLLRIFNYYQFTNDNLNQKVIKSSTVNHFIPNILSKFDIPIVS